MAHPEPLRPVPLEQTRERVIAELCRGFAEEHLEADELQSRLDGAQRATTLEELRALVADLPAVVPPGVPAPAAAGEVQIAHPSQVAEQQFVVAVMGGATRRGAWAPPRQLNVIAVMGGAELDFRQARIAPGVTEVNVFALMGGVQIVVPPGVHVEMNGIAIMGGFDEKVRAEAPPAPGSPILRIGGFAMMGGVEVTVRLAGESERDARQRARELRKAQREQRRLS
ncbi:MAG TPA: DUF1707 domain-containing protein [Longimicrobium sp.]|jgi:hypothetical protein